VDRLAELFQRNSFVILLGSGLALLSISALCLLAVILINTNQQQEDQGCEVESLGVISRAEWGAASPDQTAVGEQGLYHPVTNPGGWLVYDVPLEKALDTIVIHHTALPLSDGPREIQQLHMEDRGFADIGYHFVIDDAGLIYAGRDITVRGAHTGGQNYGKIGIVLMGNFEVLEPTEAQVVALTDLSSCLAKEYDIQYIAGHRDFQPGQTVCPGENLWPLVPVLAEVLELEYDR
jgi:hypothetical protein